MAFKYSIKLGQRAPQVVLSAGTAIAGSDAMELNIDLTKMTRMQAYDMLCHLTRKIVAEGKWPPL